MNRVTTKRRTIVLLLVAVVAIIWTEAFQTFSPLMTAKSVGRNPSCRFTSEDQTDNTQKSSSSTSSRSIVSLVENGKLDDALSILQNTDSDGGFIPASTYHAVIEACCAGKVERHNHNQHNSNNKNNSSNKSAMDKIDEAAELLSSMGEEVTAHAYETLISGYARRGRWQDAYRTLAAMEEVFGSSDDNDNTVPSLNVYQTVLIAFVEAGEYDHMNSLLTRMRRRRVRPSVYTYNSLLKICAQTSRWKEALSLLSQCQREPGVNPDLVTFTSTMRACSRARKTDKAMEIFRAVKDMGVKMDVYCYTTAMDACAKGRRWREALALLDEMKEKGFEPNEVSYGVAVTACGNGGQWEKALELLEQMREENMKINTITYNSAIAALAKSARSESRQQRRYDYKPGGGWSKIESSNPAYNDNILWKKALDLVDCMEKEGVRRDSFTFSSAISTCGAAGRWQESLDLIGAMKRETKPNKIAYTSAITACANSEKWEPAFELFNDMKNDGMQPDLVAYNALINAGTMANQPEQVFDLWVEMCNPHEGESVSPDIVTLTEVIATLDRAMGKINRDRADKVFAEAVSRGIILKADSLDSSWEVDLSRMSFPVARAACRFIFRRIVSSVKNGDEEVKDFSLITGASKMREYIREILRDELKPAVYCVVPKLEQGTLQVKEKVMRNYIDGQSD
ncbi:hypothetical protein ACHAXM_006862 [Skeletonema potamos]